MSNLLVVFLFKNFFPVLLTAFTCSLFVTPLIKKLSIKAKVYDKPSSRKIHKDPMPRLGGVAIFIGFFVAIIATLPINHSLIGVIIGTSMILVLGILDDIYSINPWLKLAGQIMAALVIYYFGISIGFISNPFGSMYYLGWMSLPVTVIWIVSITNTINLIDGVDGLAAGVAAISACVLFVVAVQMHQYVAAVMTVAIIGSSLGFLRFNYSPAQIFMGDSGAMFLGFILSVTSIIGVFKSTATLAIVIPVLILGIPISDTFMTIVRRMKNKKAIFKPDNNHIHHNLLDLGLTQKQVVFCIYMGSLFLGLLAIFLSNFSGTIAYAFFIISVICIYSILQVLRKKRKLIIAKLKMFL